LVETIATEVVPCLTDLAQFFPEVVRQSDTKSFTDRIELEVGRDPQYIRITGTLVPTCCRSLRSEGS
jgi:uncharacterized membrane-anchored protein YjiN (DUF445 family)